MTEELFRDDSYLRACDARVVSVSERGGILLDRTVFYPAGGGQPGDTGWLALEDGAKIAIATTVYDEERNIVHVPASADGLPKPGANVTCQVDWDTRYPRMKVHSALHLLCAALPYPVTGGQIGDGEGRLDFDIPEAGLDKDALSQKLNELIAKDAAVTVRWITDEELDARPELVRTMAVKPPRGSGRVRLVEIDGIDLQPCGGTHVQRTGEIGKVQVTKVEKKGAQNRRIRLALVRG
ncbi:MAG: alanyl-tRNA editing protein [Pseudomonadota bacterium]|nr:alanyl-tRNA editing protein [Pseudomonadota bacterium]